MSQESSPITQWRDSIQKTVIECVDFQDYEHKEEIRQAITSATIELALALIGEDEPAVKEGVNRLGEPRMYDDPDGLTRNAFRAELRQSLKELTE